ncbi:BolA family protein [Pinirhizobacter sp.]|uniref:BolA family protein n=1 Tax=Pinirhizobacter sp. TaxID=2950432 RepID=UPI002F3E3BD9
MTEAKVARIHALLTAALAPEALVVTDEGHKHAGHTGEGKGHFHVAITASAFAGQSPIKRHRLVYAALDSMLPDGIHALAIDARTPEESKK